MVSTCCRLSCLYWSFSVETKCLHLRCNFRLLGRVLGGGTISECNYCGKCGSHHLISINSPSPQTFAISVFTCTYHPRSTTIPVVVFFCCGRAFSLCSNAHGGILPVAKFSLCCLLSPLHRLGGNSSGTDKRQQQEDDCFPV